LRQAWPVQAGTGGLAGFVRCNYSRERLAGLKPANAVIAAIL